MLAVSMAIFAFVIAVAALGVALWTMSGLRAGALRLDSELTALRKTLALVETKTPTALAVTVDDLAGALEALKVSNRREFGKLWGTVGGRTPDGVRDGGRPGEAAIIDEYAKAARLPADPDFERMLALQAAPGSGHER